MGSGERSKRHACAAKLDTLELGEGECHDVADQWTIPAGVADNEIHCHHRSSGCGVSSEHKLGAVAVSISDRRGSRARPAGLCALLLVCVLLGVGLALPLARIVHCAAGYRAAVGAATLEMHSALSGQQQHKYLAGYGLPHPSADADVFLFVGITSNGGSKERRDAIREAWADEAQASGQVVCKFIVPEDEQNAAMLEEQALHHDIVFAPSAGPSSTSSSTSSTVLRPSTFQLTGWLRTLEYAVLHDPGARFVLRTSDDAFVNMPPLLRTLHALCPTPACANQSVLLGQLGSWKHGSAGGTEAQLPQHLRQINCSSPWLSDAQLPCGEGARAAAVSSAGGAALSSAQPQLRLLPAIERHLCAGESLLLLDKLASAACMRLVGQRAQFCHANNNKVPFV
ncbi:hypothetical protein CHLNCDRAFT_133138 [Chlorella variabilis]|uniref:Hexosyltransferase n=1 Tax=Chlorella variabilis TaxID=554065 RepID=E1Z2G0_CHLVA|nr:hypothetical protein CHLNCDRAFT_133138 [Chlorella variabilis]EFN59992.1 hypothetical protein CHLNCDRAFT_133138 [Chlorella variabilis]|eukprot:XP_005852094.1 hypothetical protein CHLNCDRAFT_133138 [Chlorella variabilis]